MRALGRALSAEALKLRGTLALWMCLIAPATVVALAVLQAGFANLDEYTPLPAPEVWQRFAVGTMTLWAFLMLPLFVTLQSALLGALEHADQRWRHLLSLPLPRCVHYLSKLIALVAMLALAMLALLVLIPLGGWVLMHWQPRFGLGGPPPWDLLLGRFGPCLAASLLVVALHTWIALRWRSFTVAVATGMVATVAGFLIGQSERFGPWYPWSMPSQVLATDGSNIQTVVLVGALGGLAVTALGLWDWARRDVD